MPSDINPRTVNGLSTTPLGRLPVTITLSTKTYQDDLHIYPGVSGALISWKATKDLGILPPSYPYPHSPQCPQPSKGRLQKKDPSSVERVTCNPVPEDLVSEYPNVFDGKICTMEGEKFDISLVEGAIPFCVKTPQSIPFAYREKLKAELQTLQDQGIIAPVAQVTEWCTPIVVTPKKGTDKIRMCVDLSRLHR